MGSVNVRVQSLEVLNSIPTLEVWLLNDDHTIVGGNGCLADILPGGEAETDVTLSDGHLATMALVIELLASNGGLRIEGPRATARIIT